MSTQESTSSIITGAASNQLPMMPGVETNLAELLMTAAEELPHRICIETTSGCWTFEQVASMAGCIRVVLRQALRRSQPEDTASCGDAYQVPDMHGMRPNEHVITVALERGVEALAAVHAIMLERCAYNCFDISEHKEKLLSWVDVAQPPVMITRPAIVTRLGLQEGSFGPCSPIILDVAAAIQKGGAYNEQARQLLKPAHDKDDLDRLAYLIFTSGSTGKPKAVMIQHKSALNVVRIWSKHVGLTVNDRFAQVASMSWDVHVIEVYGNLSARSSIVSVPDHIKKSGPDMLSFLKQSQITGMSVVPSHLRMISGGGKEDVSRAPTGLPHLQILDVGGEALGQDVVGNWAPGRRMYNSYGPSEISVVCTCATVVVGDEITIGHDLPTYTNHVLDPQTFKAVAPGERGVLFIGGIGLARGYLNEPEKTAAKFVEVEGLGRLYNSGDLVSRDTKGRIHFHGRVDWQVKVRGIRIELEALEQEISGLEAVKHCEARVIDDGSKLVLIVSGNEDLSEETLKATAASLGKGYVLSMVCVVANSAWKFNTSNKLVRNHVPLEIAASEESEQLDGWKTFDKSGASEMELEIAACIAPKVKASSWHRQSHFLEDLGVDSAGFAQLVSQLQTRSQFRCVNLLMIFQHPTVKALAARVAELASQDEDSDYEATSSPSRSQPGLPECLLSLAEQQPHAACCEEESGSRTFRQVVQCTFSAHRLLRKTLKQQYRDEPEPVVALVMDSGTQLVACMMAALLEGCAYCVIDTSLKSSEIVARMQLVKPVAVLSSHDVMADLHLEELCGGLPESCVVLDVSVAMYPSQELRRLPAGRTGTGLFCVTFAECALGKLRAVMTQHSSALQAVQEWCRLTQASAGDRSLVALSPSEAAGMLGLWCSLFAGATLLIPPVKALKSSRLMWHWIFSKRATVLGCTTSQLKALDKTEAVTRDSKCQDLRVLWMLGQPSSEPVPAPTWTPQSLMLFSAYCLPEAWALASGESSIQPRISNSGFKSILGLQPMLGRASRSKLLQMNGCNLHVLDHDLHPVQQGRQGTLFIGGAGVASGYLGDESETQENFVDVPGLGRLFRTGHSVQEGSMGLQVLGDATALRGQTMKTSFSLLRSMSSLGSAVFGLGAGSSDATEVCASEFGEDSWPLTCQVVQGLFIVSEPIWQAVKFLLIERVLLPIGLNMTELGIGWLFLIVLSLLAVQQLLNILSLIAVKWLLIGRYTEGDHAIYSLFYLRHWIVARFAQGTPVTTAGNFGLGVSANFFKNLLLKLLGADVSFSAIIAAPVTAFDLLHVGPMATVHGPNHLTAISYATRRMSLAEVHVGAGAYVGARSCLEPGSRVAAGAYVEPLSTVQAGTIVTGRVSGVPSRPVSSAGDVKPREQEPGASRKFVLESLLYVCFSGIEMLPKSIQPIFLLILLRDYAGPLAYQEYALNVDINSLPKMLFDYIWWLPLIAFVASMLTTIGTMFSTVVVCRILPKARPPLDMAFTSIRARIVAIKVHMATQLSNMLTDASIQAPMLRLCGADIGKDVMMAEQQILPDTLTVGEGSFYASGNCLTSVNIDQGRLHVPCHTVMGERTFMGNHNHIVEGLEEGCFAGLNTWVPQKPADKDTSFFGNPAMPFKRPGKQETPPKPAALMQFWFHFSSSVVDVFFWKGIKAAVGVLQFCISRSLFPEITAAWQILAVLGMYLAIPMLTWYIFNVRIGNALHNDRVPEVNDMYSLTVTAWFNSQNIVRAFPNPVKVAGSAWQGAFLRLYGAKIGRHFFSATENVLWDPAFSRIGDSVTADYDATVKMHTFADFKLKFVAMEISSGARLLQGSAISSTSVGRDAILRPGSVTWKGQTLEPETAYEGAPAEPVMDLEAGRTVPAPVLLGRLQGQMERTAKA